MIYRDGSSSTFSATGNILDSFPILRPYDPSAGLQNQNTNALEQASQINHYFDAVINIEKQTIGSLGVPIVSQIDTKSLTNNCILSYQSLTIPVSGNSVTSTVTIPAAFGANPFANKGFSLSPTVYFNTPNLKGIYANQAWSNTGQFNSTLFLPQIYTMVAPISGNTYSLTVKNIPYYTSSYSLNYTFSETFAYGEYPNLSHNQSVPLNARYSANLGGKLGPGINGIVVEPYLQSPIATPALQLSSCFLGKGQWGLITPQNMPTMGDWEVIFYLNFLPRWGINNPSYCYNRAGIILRQTGSLTNCSGYCLSIGESNTSLQARVLKVQNHNLQQDSRAYEFSDAYPNTGWRGTGNVTDLLGSGTFATFQNQAGYWYRFRIAGSVISLDYSTDKSSWSSVFSPITDGSPLPTSGAKAGFFTKALEDPDSYLGNDQPSLFFSYFDINGLNVTSTASLTNIKANILYCQIGPESDLSMLNTGSTA
jgi:hypothetical protein